MIIENNLLDLNYAKHLIFYSCPKIKIIFLYRKLVSVQNQSVICENQINYLSLQSILAHKFVYLTLRY